MRSKTFNHKVHGCLDQIKIKLKDFATCKQFNLLGVGCKFYVIYKSIYLYFLKCYLSSKDKIKQELFTMDCGGHLWGTDLTCSNTCTAHEIRGLPTHPFFRCAIFHFRFILWEWLDRFVTIAIYTKLFFFNSLMQIDLFIFGGICRQHVISKRKERFCFK